MMRRTVARHERVAQHVRSLEFAKKLLNEPSRGTSALPSTFEPVRDQRYRTSRRAM
jgi:hypothetical protein